METLLNDTIDTNILMQFEQKFKKEEAINNITEATKFEYAWCLVRTPYSDDWKQGFKYLQELYEIGDDHAKRDYLFYMAIAQFKLKNYDEALAYCKGILKVQPGNHQVIDLKVHIEKKMRKEGMIGMAVMGGASLVLGVGAAVAAALIATRKR